MKKLILILLWISALGLIAAAQCATVTVTSPPNKVPSGRKATFKATVTDAGPVKPTYLWKSGKGTIVSGQGTPEVVVSTTGIKPHDILTVTVTIGPYPLTCNTVVAAGSVSIDYYVDAWKQYSWLAGAAEEEKTRLETINKRLTYFGGKETLYIFAYPGPGGKRSDAEAELKRITGLLAAMSPSIAAAQIKTATGGQRSEPTIELWLAPPGVEAPVPDPAAKQK